MEKFNIVIGTHGRFGEELVKSAAMIAGNMGRVKACSLLPEYSFEDYMRLVDKTLSELDDGFTIVLVDLYGGTPCNTFTVLSQKYHYDVLTGLNLPMLIEIAMLREFAASAQDVVTQSLLRKPSIRICRHVFIPISNCMEIRNKKYLNH